MGLDGSGFDSQSKKWRPLTMQAMFVVLIGIGGFVLFPFFYALPEITWALSMGTVQIELPRALSAVVALCVTGLILLVLWWRRRMELHALADELGCCFSVNAKKQLTERLAFLDIFDEDEKPSVSNLIHGPFREVDGFQLRIFDLKRQDPEHQHQMEQGTLICYGNWHTPRVVITPIAEYERPGLERVEFELNEFNERYQVLSDDRKFAYALLTPQVIEALMEEMPLAPSATYDLHRGVLVVRKIDWLGQAQDDLWNRDDILRALTLAKTLMTRVPQFLRDDHAELRCCACNEAQPQPSVACHACGATLADESAELALAMDRLSPIELVGYGALLCAVPFFNFVLAIILSERWRQNKMKWRRAQVGLLLAVAVTLQLAAAWHFGLIEDFR